MHIRLGRGQTYVDDGDWYLDKIVYEEQDIDNNEMTLPIQFFEMLEALPNGIKWNPRTEQFEKTVV